jgi:hypothetical protein
VPAPAAIANLQPGKWLELPNTKISSVFPMPTPQGYPAAVTLAWGGGTVDTVRNRLLVWGGGHSDYYGNEMYALDLSTLTINRILDPSSKTSQSSCSSALPDGTPTSRHTYGGMAYIGHQDRFFAISGSLAPCGYAEPAAWTYDFPGSRWQMMMSKSPSSGPAGTMSIYDAATGQVFVKDTANFFSYSLENNKFTKLNTSDQFLDYHLSAAIDSKRRKFVMLGDGVQVIDLKTNVMTRMSTSNTPSFVTSQQSPGVAYDPVADRIVAWHGGGNVYALNMDTGAWTQVATGPGPTTSAPTQGTFGRWAYVPQYRVFVLINSTDENAWVFRLAN